MQPFVGQIIAVGFNYAPVDWYLCNGQLLSIADNQVLYVLLGTTYGGDGIRTFAVPDLRGRSPLGLGTGLGLPTYALGQTGGSESVTLTSQQIAAHAHPLLASANPGATPTPSSTAALANQGIGAANIYGAAPGALTLAPTVIGATGGNLPHENRQPFNTVNYIISAFGVYPSQS
jgi:microcystin-dependent protein